MALPGPRAAARPVLKLTCTPSIKLSERSPAPVLPSGWGCWCPALGVGAGVLLWGGLDGSSQVGRRPGEGKCLLPPQCPF